MWCLARLLPLMIGELIDYEDIFIGSVFFLYLLSLIMPLLQLCQKMLLHILKVLLMNTSYFFETSIRNAQ